MYDRSEHTQPQAIAARGIASARGLLFPGLALCAGARAWIRREAKTAAREMDVALGPGWVWNACAAGRCDKVMVPHEIEPLGAKREAPPRLVLSKEVVHLVLVPVKVDALHFGAVLKRKKDMG